MAYRAYEGYAYGAPVAPYGYGAVPAAPVVPPYGGGYGSADELRTVFITGFPNDIKERELNNLLRFIPGYEASQMNWKNGQVSPRSMINKCTICRAHRIGIRLLHFSARLIPALLLHCSCLQAQGFALFVNGGAARAACDQIAGLW